MPCRFKWISFITICHLDTLWLGVPLPLGSSSRLWLATAIGSGPPLLQKWFWKRLCTPFGSAGNTAKVKQERTHRFQERKKSPSALLHIHIIITILLIFVVFPSISSFESTTIQTNHLTITMNHKLFPNQPSLPIIGGRTVSKTHGGRVYSGALRADARSGAFAVALQSLAESTEECLTRVVLLVNQTLDYRCCCCCCCWLLLVVVGCCWLLLVGGCCLLFVVSGGCRCSTGSNNQPPRDTKWNIYLGQM